MPYTPPSQRSPAASSQPSPNVSRSNSYIKSLDHPVPGVAGVGYFAYKHNGGGPRPGLPRSASSTAYLNKERRSPTAPKQSFGQDAMIAEDDSNDVKIPTHSGSLRQSPPPLNNNLIPTGAVISPPDSTQNSSDDDEENTRGRPRKLENLEELQNAVSSIHLQKDGSPERYRDSGKPRLFLEVTAPSPQPTGGISPPLSREQRKISHSKSNTISDISELVPRSLDSSSPERSSDDDLIEIAGHKKPPMLRKKSGELVKPAIRPAAKRRPSSMPGTPTYNKQVHFGEQIQEVKTFDNTERPSAVSAGSSPVENYDSETEFPWDSKKEIPWEWEIKTPNFPTNPDRKHQPIMVEKIYLSNDKKFLIGAAIVRNLAFQKSVVARFTLDYWKTTSEVAADFSHDIRKEIPDGCDRFMFNIKLADQTNLENKTLFFCVRYNVNGEEFWDSNGMMNFQVEFSKKNIPQHGKRGMLGNHSKSTSALSSLPRSTRQRPTKLPTFDDFADADGPFALGSPPDALFLTGEKPMQLRLRQKSVIAPGALGAANKSVQAFASRYDFGASLSATKNGSPTFSELRPQFAPGTPPIEKTPEPTQKSATATGETPKPAALSEKPSLSSQSYNELINKYCFFGTPAKSSPTVQRSGNGQTDGNSDDNGSPAKDYGFTSQSPPAANASGSEKISSPRTSSTSPLNSPLGPRAASPLGYPFPQSMQGSLFDPQTPTAILS